MEALKAREGELAPAEEPEESSRVEERFSPLRAASPLPVFGHSSAALLRPCGAQSLIKPPTSSCNTFKTSQIICLRLSSAGVKFQV